MRFRIAPGCLRRGFLLVEVLVGFALLSMFLTAVGLSLLVSHKGTLSAGDRIRAAFLAEEALEGVRSIRDESFASVAAGDHGVRVSSGSTSIGWIFDGIQRTTPDGYTTRVTVTPLGTGWLQVDARTSWNHGQGRSGTLLLSTELLDWGSVKTAGDWSLPSILGSYTDGGTPLFNDVAVSGDYAFVSSETSAGGDGLYVFDISNPTSPQRVASSFDLAAAGYDLVLNGDTLYVATDDAAEEIRAYDVSSPSTLASGNKVASYNMPGSGRARSLARRGTALFAGALEDAAEAEFYSLDIASSTGITLLDALQVAGGIEDISIRSIYAYLSTADDVSELRVVNVNDASDVTSGAGSGYNLTDVLDGLGIAVTGTSAVLGRSAGAAVEELVLFDLETGSVPDPPPGPWFHDAGAAVNALAVDPAWHYAFAATEFSSKEFLVMNLWRWRNGGVAEAGYYDTDTGNGRGVSYDAWNDRVYLVTNTAFIILEPA